MMLLPIVPSGFEYLEAMPYLRGVHRPNITHEQPASLTSSEAIFNVYYRSYFSAIFQLPQFSLALHITALLENGI